MQLNEYQDKAKSTAQYPVVDLKIRDNVISGNFLYPLLGVAEEAGELVGKIAKIVRNNDGIISLESRKTIALELGDILWMLSMVSAEFGFTLEEVAQMNIDKLQDRLNRNVIKSAGDNR